MNSQNQFQNPLLEFVTNENVDLLWEVIMENKKVDNKDEFRKYFIDNLKFFFQEQQKQFAPGNKFDLVETNKSFISQFVLQGSKQVNTGSFVTAEEIQKNRMSEFEQEFVKKQNEFKQFMTHQVPETPQFSEKLNDEPIGDMTNLIAMTLTQRNLDIDQLRSNIDKKEVEKWLKAQDTSIKPVKSAAPNFNQVNQINQNIKYIKIGDEIDTTNAVEIGDNQLKKSVSWEDHNGVNSNRDEKEMQNTMHLFSKLKQVSNEDNGNHNMKMLEKMEAMMKKIDELNHKLNAFIEERTSKNTNLL
jgi:hypothetical protein